jgi:hypothetical protein
MFGLPKSFLCVALVFSATQAIAAPLGYPLFGQLSSKEERGQSMNYSCITEGQVLHCQFTQVLISHPTQMTDAQIDTAVTSSQGKQLFDKEFCRKIDAAIKMLSDGRSPDPRSLSPSPPILPRSTTAWRCFTSTRPPA